MKPLPPRIGRYEVVDRLGSGGMGVVYLATDPVLRRTVAIKVLPGQDEELRERFAREARSAAALRHNNVVTIYDVGEDEGQPFIAMEFLDGESMAEMIRRKAPLPTKRRLRLMIELCAGLGYAHRCGIIHRDIKPANLMITTEGTLKILDFGLARLGAATSQAGLTQVGAVLGTPHYMSPEQVEGASVDHRSDIFAVGLVLYEFLTSHKAYTGDSAHLVLHNIVHKSPTPIRTLLPTIDASLERVVGKGIEKEPSRRYQSLSDFASDLERVHDRLQEEVAFDESTIVERRGAPPPPTGSPRRPPGDGGATPRKALDRDALAHRRLAQVEQRLAAALQHFEAQQYDAAIEECENALVIDPENARALQLLNRSHQAIDDALVGRWLDEAKGLLASGELTEAEGLVEQSLRLRADSELARMLRQGIKEKRRQSELDAERLRATNAAVDRARRHLREGAYDAAARSASEALAYAANHPDAMALKSQALSALTEQRSDRERDHAVLELIQSARARAEAGDIDGALAQLRTHPPIDGRLDQVIVDLERELFLPEPRESDPEPAWPPVAGNQPATERLSAHAPPGAAVPLEVRPPRAKRLPPALWAIGLAGVLILAIGAGLQFMASDSPEASPAVVVPPVPPADVPRILLDAADKYQDGDIVGAINTVSSIPASAPESAQSLKFLEGIRIDLEQRVQVAKKEADEARASTHASYISALEKYAEGVRLSTPVSLWLDGQVANRAVGVFVEAASLFQASTKIVIDKPVSSPFADRLRQAARSFEAGDYARAAAIYRTVLSEEPENTEAKRGLTRVARAQKADEDVVRRGPTLSPEQTLQVSRHLADGERYLSDGEYASAIKQFEMALQIDSANVRAASGIAEIRKIQAAEAKILDGLRKKPGA